MKVLEDTPAVLTLGKLCDEHGYSYEWINGQKPHLIDNGIRIQCNTENFVPIVVPVWSKSSSPSLPSSTSMAPSRQEIDHPKSSSSSSTSPSMTSSTVSSESVDRQERWDPCGIDHHLAILSSERVEREERGDLLTKPTKIQKPNKNESHDQVQGDPCHSDIPEWLQEFRENLVDDRVPEHRDLRASSSHDSSLEPKLWEVRIWVNTVLILTSLKTEIAKSARGPKSQGPVQKTQWRSRTSSWQFWWLSRSQGPQWQLRVSEQPSICSRGPGLGHPMDPGVSVQNQNFTRNPEKLAKVPGTREEA